jgi:putative endonuclease
VSDEFQVTVNPKSYIRNPKFFNMSASQELGIKGEELAACHLAQNGYRILFRNWKYGKLEIDIIAENDEFIVFVEVKTRSADPLDPPVNAITREKQRGLVWAADAYIKRYGINKESRFDVITLIEKGEEFEITHIPYAFYPSLR